MDGRAGTVDGRTTGSPRPGAPAEHTSGAGPAPTPPHRSSRRWPLRSYLELSPLATAVPCFRLHTRLVLSEWDLATVAGTVELIVSELTTNSVRASLGLQGSRYGGIWKPGTPPVRLWLCSDRRQVVVNVWDGNDQPPRRGDPDPEAEGGRGLLLVETLAAKWGTYTPTNATGKIVWATIRL